MAFAFQRSFLKIQAYRRKKKKEEEATNKLIIGQKTILIFG